MAAEFGAALRVGDRTVQHRMSDATVLVDRFPLVRAAQGAGRTGARGRRVWAKDGIDGMGELGLLGPAALVHGAFERLTAMATSIPQHDRLSEPSIDANTRSDANAPAFTFTEDGTFIHEDNHSETPVGAPF